MHTIVQHVQDVSNTVVHSAALGVISNNNLFCFGGFCAKNALQSKLYIINTQDVYSSASSSHIYTFTENIYTKLNTVKPF